jgi:hypothetical protein
MGVNRRPHLITALVVLAMLLGSLWAGALAAGTSAGQLTATRAGLGADASVPPDRAPALRPAPERPDPGGRLLPLLLGLLAAVLGVTSGLRPRPSGLELGPAGPLAWPGQRAARAPPSLQPS